MKIKRIEKFQHAGIEILHLDHKDCPREEYEDLFKAFMEVVKKAPDRSLNILTFFHSNYFDPTQANLWKQGAEIMEKKVRRSVVYGMSPIDQARLQAYRDYAKLQGQELGKDRAVAFETKEEALKWLVRP